MEAAGKYSDIISVNYYNEWVPDIDKLDMWVEKAKKPFIINEFYTKGYDTGFPNKDGAGWVVETQKDRAVFFENFVIKLMKHPGCLGYHWFRYMDQNETNKGIIDENYQWYVPLKESFAKINKDLYRLRSQLLFGNVNLNGTIDKDGFVCGSHPTINNLTIDLVQGWNLISINLHPSDSSIVSLFNGLNVDVIKTTDSFWQKGVPTYLNSPQNIRPGNGYLVNMNTAGTLTVTGTPVVAQLIASQQKGWQLIGCPYQAATPFSDVFNTSNCESVKNFYGFWVPDGTINSINNFEPGKGYYLNGK